MKIHFLPNYFTTIPYEHYTTTILCFEYTSPIFRSTTWVRLLAKITALLIAHYSIEQLADQKGLYHLAGDGYCSRYQWAQAILESDPEPQTRRTRQVLPAKSADFPTPAQRPPFSALNCERFASTFGLRLPPWKEALSLALQPS
jgi:dTDP-4-dehydrorhamnose reductase